MAHFFKNFFRLCAEKGGISLKISLNLRQSLPFHLD